MITSERITESGRLARMNLASRIAQEYAGLPQVEAIALAGSQTTLTFDQHSDLDFYVYLNSELPLAERETIAKKFADHPETGNLFFESGDEWLDRETGIAIDVMFRDVDWIEAQIERVVHQHQASMGYSTCLWHNILHSQVLFDQHDWLSSLQKKADQPYPEPLRRAIIAKNFPILRNTQSSYLYQLRRAVERGDQVSIQHRITAILASYFDLLFAINRIPHPGEKRLVEFARAKCERRPEQMPQQIDALITSVPELKFSCANELIDDLEKLLD